jgi:S1-C subfamily serine protease
MGRKRTTKISRIRGWFSEHKILISVFLLSCLLWAAHHHQQHRKPDIDRILNSVVTIEKGNGNVVGTGFFFSQDGCILTANHVVSVFASHEHAIYIRQKGRIKRFVAAPAIRSSHLDIAILCSTEVVHTPDYLRIVYTEGVRRGDKVFVVGHPAGRTWNMTGGIVTKKSYRAYPVGIGPWVLRYTIFTDAVIWHGNSGGPILDEYGNVIGIITNFDALDEHKHPAGLNMAVTGTDIKRLLETL